MNDPIQSIIQVIRNTFEKKGQDKYGVEEVTQLQHALQSARLAESSEAGAIAISAALLHDIGHIMQATDLPASVEENLHDHHEERAYAWLKIHFGLAVADPVRLHVAAKRYLCTIDKSYSQQLSPTSFKSYVDQGGEMNDEEKAGFESEPFYKEALALRKWDDLAKDSALQTPHLSHFEPYLREAIEKHRAQR